MLNDMKISKLIINGFNKKLNNALNSDVAIVGAGPSGLVAAYYLAKDGYNVSLFESKLAPGGGMWGGGMMFNEIVVQKDAIHILDEFEIKYTHKEDEYYTADSVESTSALINRAKKAGVNIFNLVKAVDVVLKDNAVKGLVISWTPVEYMQLHVDPLTIGAKAVLDATGHPSEIANTLIKKAGVRLDTPTGGVQGEKPMNAELGEKETVENTKEIYKNFFVSGMAANGVFGGFRMGPIFGGMLLSGHKVYQLIKEAISKE